MATPTTPPATNEPIFEVGDTIKHKGLELECIMVNHRERDGVKEMLVYSFRPKPDVDKEREGQKGLKKKDNLTEEGSK